mmetsp:Transcript_3116/g.6996  ORF Transcript_3116/g.6996 Transcript_3116/m.6996 type:complete len:275 (-) Transcript_3116:573-1397(-)
MRRVRDQLVKLGFSVLSFGGCLLGIVKSHGMTRHIEFSCMPAGCLKGIVQSLGVTGRIEFSCVPAGSLESVVPSLVVRSVQASAFLLLDSVPSWFISVCKIHGSTLLPDLVGVCHGHLWVVQRLTSRTSSGSQWLIHMVHRLALLLLLLQYLGISVPRSTSFLLLLPLGVAVSRLAALLLSLPLSITVPRLAAFLLLGLLLPLCFLLLFTLIQVVLELLNLELLGTPGEPLVEFKFFIGQVVVKRVIRKVVVGEIIVIIVLSFRGCNGVIVIEF